MDPYYEHMHTFGPVNKGAGVDNGMHQMYGKRNLNGLTANEAVTLMLSTPMVIGATAAVAATWGLLGSEFGIYLNGFQRGLTRKQVAKRHAALGAIVGVLALGVTGYTFVKT